MSSRRTDGNVRGIGPQRLVSIQFQPHVVLNLCQDQGTVEKLLKVSEGMRRWCRVEIGRMYARPVMDASSSIQELKLDV